MNKNGDGGAEGYEGVSIEWIRGNDPIMTIYDDGVEQEALDLSKIKTIPEMHHMMVDKGFIKKDIGEDKEVIKNEVDEETAAIAKIVEKMKMPLVTNEVKEKKFVEEVVEREEGDYLQSEVRRQERIVEAAKERGRVVEPRLPRNYMLLVPISFFAIFLMLRYRKRRRSRRHIV